MSKADCISEGKSPFRNVGGVRSCPKNLMCCRSPYNEYPCQGMGGICMDENVCERAEGKVIRLTKNGRWGCPSQPSNILCCKKIKPAQNNCGLASGPESSIGKSAGKIADRSKWPWIADLTGVDMSLGCAGVLISSTTVLTAAHCVSHE